MTNEGKNALLLQWYTCAALIRVKRIKKEEVKGMCLRSVALQWYTGKTLIYGNICNVSLVINLFCMILSRLWQLHGHNHVTGWEQP